MPFRLVFAGVLFALLAGCASSPDTRPATEATTPLAVAVATPRNYAADGLDATAWVQNSVAHDAIFVQTYRDARLQLQAALDDPDRDALVPAERNNDFHGLPPAVILDIDETVLDNSPYQVRLIRTGASYSDDTWADWVREEAARALPGALEFTNYAADHGVQVFYISNRDQALDEATLANLQAVGFPVSGPEAFLGLGAKVDGCQQVGTNKTCRRQLVARDYRVLMMFGDQIGDFMSLPKADSATRKMAVAPHMDWFGTRWFMLPNPTYGSWVPALFGNDWSLDARQQHQQKLESLRAK